MNLNCCKLRPVAVCGLDGAMACAVHCYSRPGHDVGLFEFYRTHVAHTAWTRVNFDCTVTITPLTPLMYVNRT